jgi:Ca-activated chloride channel homolog
MDLSYLEQFRCIGTYSEAETKDAFRQVLKTVINKVLYNTTAQINLNDIQGKPVETDVTIFMYEAGTQKLKYTFEHTINRFNNPDTLIIDPGIKYDMTVFTIPIVEKKNITLQKNTHNIIPVDVPQGFIKTRLLNGTRSATIETRVMQHTQQKTLNVQQINTTDKYLVGKYDVEILTLPRIYKSIEVTQSSITNVDIEAPGTLNYKATKTIVGQIFVLGRNDVWEWVCNLDEKIMNGYWNLQPGSYKVVYRQKALKSTSYTSEKEFKIYSNKTVLLNL